MARYCGPGQQGFPVLSLNFSAIKITLVNLHFANTSKTWVLSKSYMDLQYFLIRSKISRQCFLIWIPDGAAVNISNPLQKGSKYLFFPVYFPRTLCLPISLIVYCVCCTGCLIRATLPDKGTISGTQTAVGTHWHLILLVLFFFEEHSYWMLPLHTVKCEREWGSIISSYLKNKNVGYFSALIFFLSCIRYFQ